MKVSLQKLVNRSSALSLILLQTAQYAEGHYGFPFVVVNGVASERWEYIRPSTSFGPNFDYSGPDSMCGPNGTSTLFPVKTLKIEAGSSITFGASGQKNRDESAAKDAFDPSFYIYHDGPSSAFLSKAPEDVELNDYKGEGDWFKIASVGAKDGLMWDVSSRKNVNTMTFTVPKTTPPGKYLMRVEHLNILTSYGATQMYANCAHLEISGPGGGEPSPVTKFPGAFNAKDSGIWLPNALYQPYRPMDELKNWQGAGPKVWSG